MGEGGVGIVVFEEIKDEAGERAEGEGRESGG